MNSFNSAIKGLIRNFAMSSASILLVSLTLLVVGSVLVVGVNTLNVSKNIVDSVSIYAYVDQDITAETIETLKTNVSELEGVDTVTYSTPEQELTDLMVYFEEKDASSIEENYTGDKNPLFGSLQISINESVKDITPIVASIQEIEGVKNVNDSSTDGLTKLIDLINVVQLFSLGLAILLFSVSIFIITNTIRLAITARRKEIEIMRLVGATKMYIRSPFIIEGMIIGLIGSLVATGVIGSIYNAIFTSQFFAFIQTSIYIPKTMVIILITALPIFGMLIGVVGSIIALRKHLRT